MISLTVADRQTLETARPAVAFHGQETGFGDNAAAVIHDFARENLIGSRRAAFDERFNEQLDLARKMGATDLPFIPNYGTPTPDELNEIRDKFAGNTSAILNIRAHKWDQFFAQMKQQHPDAGFMTIQDANDDISRDFAERRLEVARIRANATFAGDVGATLGYVAAPLQEPLVLATLPFGAAGSAGILRTMLTEALIASGTEALIQPEVFRFKQQIDSPYTVEDAVTNVAAAGVGAGLVAGTIKTVPIGYRALLDHIRAKRAAGELPEPTPTQRAAEEYLERYMDEVESNPNRRDQPDGLAVHSENLKTADSAAMRGEGISPDEVKATKTGDPERRLDIAQRQKVNTLRQQIDEMTARVERGEAKPKELTKLIRELKEAIYTDALTSIPNRRAWDEAEKMPFVAAIDLDGFKLINDRMGHGVGDEALQIVARILQEETGAAYRYGGDEFTAQAGKGASLEKSLKRAEARLANEKLEVVYPDGSKDTKHGIELTYAISRSYQDADLQTKATKDARRAARAAAGGAAPGLVRTPAPGNANSLNRGAPDRAAAQTAGKGRNQGLSRESLYDEIGEAIGGVSHLKPLIKRAARIFDEHGLEAGEAILERMLDEDAMRFSNNGDRPWQQNPDLVSQFVDELSAEIRKRLDPQPISPARARALAKQSAEDFDSTPEARTEVLHAEVERVLAERPDLMVPDADGKPIPIQQMLDELKEDDATLSVVNACLKGPV